MTWTEDPDNDCMHGHFQGIGCAPCEEASRRFVAALVALLAGMLLVALVVQQALR